MEGLPEGADPSFALQLSSPIEELILDKLFDPLAPTENLAVFSGVEASVATLTVSAKDADIELGVSVAHDVAPLCPIDAMSPKSEYVTELVVSIVAEGDAAVAAAAAADSAAAETEEDVFDDANEDAAEEAEPTGDEKDKETSPVVEATCTVTLRITYKPSSKDQREELYDLLNKASQQKAKAIDRLRKSATAAARAAPSTEITTSSKPAVKPGFLNKKKREPSKLKVWYERTLGPQSFLRRAYPVAKNYVIFFGAVALFHYQGQEVAIPPPV